MDEEKKGEELKTNPQSENPGEATPPDHEEETFFRKGKVDKFISPEDLNSLIQIIRPKEWVGLACLGLIVCFLFIWLFNGRITTDAVGRGLVVQKEGLLYLYAKSDGLIYSVELTQGQIVNKSTVIAYLYEKNFLDSFNDQGTKVHQLEINLKKAIENGDSSESLLLRTQLENETQILQGMQDNPVLVPIYSEVEGEVIARYVGAGEFAQAGLALGLVDPPFDRGEPIDVYGFFDVTNGGRIAEGMEVFISFEKYVNPIYGSLKGKVVYVDPYPGTSMRFLRLIGKDQTFIEFIGGIAPKYNIRVEIEKDSNDPSGYAWTSGKGPENLRITPEFCHLRVRITEDAPINYLFN